MQKKLDLKIILPAAIVIAIAIYLALINITRIYQSETDILIIPKNPVTAESSGQILENAVQLAHSVSFYNRTVLSDAEINNPVKVLPEMKRKNYWDSKIETEKIGDSGIIRIVVSDASMTQSETISRGASRSLIDAMSGYYNIKTDLDMRIIDGPSTAEATSENIFWIILESILAGLILAVLTERLSLFFVKNIEIESGEKKSPYPAKKFEKFWKFDEAEKPAPEVKKEFTPKVEKKIITPDKKQSAPGNLPIADESALFKVQEKLYPNGEVDAELPEKMKSELILKELKKKSDIFREATPEEVKERLNKLLSGRL